MVPAGIRKTVTILFCDVVDSTGLGDRLDAEALREVMGRYFDVARPLIERHGGSVDKFIGDAVLGVFGVPRVQTTMRCERCERPTISSRRSRIRAAYECGLEWQRARR